MSDRPILRIIKIGGASVTKKSEFETIDKSNLVHFVNEIIKPIHKNGKTIIIHGYLHSICLFTDRYLGAGSYGHFQAKEYQISTANKENIHRIGFAKTQQSVRKLQSLILNELLEANVIIYQFECPDIYLDSGHWCFTLSIMVI